MVAWVGATATLFADQISRVRTAASKAILGEQPSGASQALRWTAAHQPEDDPIFAMEAAALQALLQHESRRRRVGEWTKGFEVDYADSVPFQWSATLRAVFKKYTWVWDNSTKTLQQAGTARSLRILWDGKHTLRDWHIEAWRQALFSAEKRLIEHVHRQGDDLACGLVLPSPPPDAVYNVAPLQRAFYLQDNPAIHRLAVGAGVHCWEMAKKHGEATKVCRCGRVEPSTAHHLWVCTASQGRREQFGSKAPTDKAEERLLVRPVAPRPNTFVVSQGAPPTEQKLVYNLLGAMRRQNGTDATQIIVACDGSADKGVATWAAAHGKFATGAQVVGEDQSSVAAEVEGIRQVVTAAAAAAELAHSEGRQLDLHLEIVVDCKAAIQLAQCAIPQHYIGQWEQINDAFVYLSQMGIAVRVLWVPSHGKSKKGWVPDRMEEEVMRKLNDAADVKARELMHDVVAKSGVARWYREWDAAADWTEKAMEMGSAIAADLADFYTKEAAKVDLSA